MRLMTGLFASLCVVGLSATLAGEPPAASATPQTGQQASTSASPAAATSTNATAAKPMQPASASGTQNPAPAGAPVPSDQAAAADAQKLDRLEKTLLSQGYKPETRNGQKVYCRREAAVGSRFERKVCGSASDLQAITQDSQELTRKIQESGASPAGK